VRPSKRSSTTRPPYTSLVLDGSKGCWGSLLYAVMILFGSPAAWPLLPVPELPQPVRASAATASKPRALEVREKRIPPPMDSGGWVGQLMAAPGPGTEISCDAAYMDV